MSLDGATVSWVLTSSVGSKYALLNDTTRCRQCGSNSEPLDSESDALQLCHRDPNPQVYTSLLIQHDEAIACSDDTAKSISEFSITSS